MARRILSEVEHEGELDAATGPTLECEIRTLHHEPSSRAPSLGNRAHARCAVSVHRPRHTGGQRGSWHARTLPTHTAAHRAPNEIHKRAAAHLQERHDFALHAVRLVGVVGVPPVRASALGVT